MQLLKYPERPIPINPLSKNPERPTTNKSSFNTISPSEAYLL